jgi:N-acetylmuramoyl-L-alanine amidase
MSKMTNDELINDKIIKNVEFPNWSLVIRHYFLILVSSFIILTTLVLPSLASDISITKIEARRRLGIDYLDIHTTGYVKGKGLLLEDQLVIDFPNSKIAEDIEISTRKSKRIKNIEASQANENTARVTIELKKDIDYEIVNIFGRGKSIIEIYDRIDQAERIMAAWEKANLKTKAEALKTYKYKPYLEGKKSFLRGKVVVIDPGHGGRDPGSISLGGIPEKRLTLQTAKKAAKLLSTAGATVYLTRNKDRSCNLKDIVNFTNKIDADIFISLHYNFCAKPSISGTETYYYNRYSRSLALIMHKTLINGIKRKDRGLRRAMYYTVHHAQMPAILIEPVYISNPKEEKLARSSAFQDEIAADILRGVEAYFRSRNG